MNYLLVQLTNKEKSISKNNQNLKLDIKSDKQKITSSNKVIAEGNVIIQSENAILNADKLSYDQKSKKLII